MGVDEAGAWADPGWREREAKRMEAELGMKDVNIELDIVRQELAEARVELRHKEAAPIEGRVADEDRYMVSLLRLQKRVRDLEAEERRLEQEDV